MKHFGRRKAQQWLAPLRKALRDIRQTGEALVADDHPVMEMPDAYIPIDYCVEGFTRMINRVLPSASVAAVRKVVDLLAAGEGVTVAEVDAALAEINQIEPLIARVSRQQIKDAVLTETIAIELDCA